MSHGTENRHWPEILDRLIEVMHHFYCSDPAELELLLGVDPGSLSRLFRSRTGNLPPAAVEALARAGVRPEYMLRGEGSMLTERIDRTRLDILRRHAAHLLGVISSARTLLSVRDGVAWIPLHVTDSQGEPVSLDEELAALLIEALRDKGSRERLLDFIRQEASNRHTTRP